MAKYEEPFKDTLEIFQNVISVADLERLITVKILSDNKSKKIYNVYKSSPLVKYETKNDVYIFVNEVIFEQLEEWQKIMVAEEAIAGIYYDAEKDKLEIKKHDVNSFSGLLRKHGYDRYEVLQESIKTLYNVEKETAEV